MTFKLVEIATPDERVRAVISIAKEMEVTDLEVGPLLDDGRRNIRLLVGEIDRLALLDRLHAALGKSENWRIIMLPTDTVISRVLEEEEEEEEAESEEDDEEIKKEEQARASREELYNLVAGGTRLDINFLLLVVLSAVVASVGLGRGSAAVVIGAMVIAPLLGPNVAFAFATAIGDHALMLSAARANLLGFGVAILVAAAMALILTPNVASPDLLALSSLDYGGIILAIASGAAAALSVTTGLSSTMVGVMVAVALLPPAVTLGIMSASGRWDLAAGAAMLLGANIASVNLSAQIVFLAKGIRPRLWRERRSARLAVALNLTTSVILLGALALIITLHHSVK
ncbi:MAG: TIGR00341 family protein [Methylocystis sp.]|uniref:TIGR00341 family protein n=1 Tax=Methylocystis sp. TaxID=1911079 RepID=UPI003D13119C